MPYMISYFKQFYYCIIYFKNEFLQLYIKYSIVTKLITTNIQINYFYYYLSKYN